ncbi:hypothetical protein D3C74_467750 [compost metagenome]
MCGCGFKAKLKGHATENQANQHQGQRNGERVNNDRIGQRKCAKKRRTTENQPGFISVPDRGDAVDHHIAIVGILSGWEQNPDT